MVMMTRLSAHFDHVPVRSSDMGAVSPGKPHISVIIPTLDEVLRIEDCLVSIGKSPDIEIVITDGGSRDGTLNVVNTVCPDAIVVSGSPNRGGQLNRGAAAATTTRLLFLHADCELPDGWLAEVMNALDDEETVLTVFRLRTSPADGSRAGAWGRFWLSAFDLRSRGMWLPYGDQGFALRRAVFDAIGGFPDIPLMEDFALARSCRRRGRIQRLPLCIRTSARRFEGREITSRLILATFPTLFKLGVPPETLARWYGVVR